MLYSVTNTLPTKRRATVATPPAPPAVTMSDEDANDLFIDACEAMATQLGMPSRRPHLNEDIVQAVTKKHPELAAGHKRYAADWRLRASYKRR